VEILDEARRLGDAGSPLVFPSRRGKPVSATTLPKMLQQHAIAAVPHGFRSSFRDWCVFRGKWNADSGGSGTRISEEVEHRFRRKWNSGSGGRERSSVA
jgi:integrase